MKPLNLLIVDDDRNLAKTLADGLRKQLGESITTVACFDAPEALSLIHQQAFDLVISDFSMPEMTGIDLFRQVRDVYPQMILILITAYGTDVLKDEAHQLVDAYITKPFELSTLIQFIQPERNAADATRKHRILILEDDVYLRRLMSKVLKSQDFEIYQAANLKEARELLRASRFDVFISDIQVPDGQGVDLIREFRESLTREGTSVIMVTGEAQFRFMEDELGIDMYLEKPIAINDLSMLVKRLMNLPSEKAL
jgi:DNA-binding NtrC family response regulator